MVAVHFLDQRFDQLFRHLKIRDHTITQRAYRLDITGRLTQHMFGVLTNRQNLTFPAHVSHRHHARFIQHNPLAANINQRVRSAQVNGHITGKQS